ncbi:hypothetical protein C9374_014320 [Naegleria lovaniensis]|nr:uncharacterized protein C9374_014320 [Naegleria lovaniensis]KAG2370689.1 hypothetical protein C9374_014320 [Naegleria lovaniensis]
MSDLGDVLKVWRDINSLSDEHEKNITVMCFIQHITTKPRSNSPFIHLCEITGEKHDHEQQFWIHQVMEEFLDIYFNPSLDQLRLLTDFILLFVSIFSEFRLIDLCSIKAKLLELDWFLPFIMYLLFSYFYPLRDATFTLLKIMIPFPYLAQDYSQQSSNNDNWFVTIDKKQFVTDSLSIYIELTDCKNWMTQLGDHTFKTKFLSLTFNEAKAVVKEYERWFFGSSTVNEDDEETLNRLSEKIDRIIHSNTFLGSAFVKLSHRSPKDAAFRAKNYEGMVHEMVLEFHEKYNLEMENQENGDLKIKNNKYQSAISQICAQKCMKVTSGKEFINLMSTSYRSHVDLSIMLQSISESGHIPDEMPIQIVVREWTDLPIWREVRTFVRNRKITTMSQYFSTSYFPQVTMDEWKKIKDIIVERFDNQFSKILPLDDCCVDFVVLNLEQRLVKIIELNAFGDNCGPALFNWDNDADRLLMYNGPLEFRVGTPNIHESYKIVD